MSEDPLKHSKSELSAASRAIEAMQAADSMDRFESEWREFLSCIEKAWNKVERTCQPQRAKFQPWQGTFHSLRKKDMLLRYLKQARDADNHSIQDMTAIKPESRIIKSSSPSGSYIKSMTIFNGEVISYEGDPIVQIITPPHPIAIPVKTSGEWHNPPTFHLGTPVPDLHPVTLAKLGLSFYTDFVDQVEKKFFT